MAKNQSEKVIANQDFLKEAWQHGGPDGLRNHYMNAGAQQERTRLLHIVINIGTLALKVAEPFIKKYASERFIAFLDKHQKNQDTDDQA